MREDSRQRGLRISCLCRLLGLRLRSLYPRQYKTRPTPTTPKSVKKRDTQVERRVAIVSLALAYPWWGYKRIAVIARREGWKVSDRKVYKIMRKLDLLQDRKRPNGELFQAAKLYELLPTAPNQLFQTDVTYINIPGHGWWYAVTVIDYFSRYLLACHLTPSYRAADCVKALDIALDEAERLTGSRPENITIVTDNGSSFLARRFRQVLKEYGFEHARIRYRTPAQLGLLERFHGTLKREEVYWHIYENPQQARESLEAFRQRYNRVRPHWALIPEEGGDPVTPIDVYLGHVKCRIPKWQGWAKGAKKKIEEGLGLTLATGT